MSSFATSSSAAYQCHLRDTARKTGSSHTSPAGAYTRRAKCRKGSRRRVLSLESSLQTELVQLAGSGVLRTRLGRHGKVNSTA